MEMEMEDETTTTRIFVGGLGENVKEADMEQIFRASLGRIDGIDFIRTKGRCFAYLNFVPSSSKSLHKLFSTYNGCVWKGGRLKLEKAKEHYLIRLKREWEEDAKLVTALPTKDVEPIAPLPFSKRDPQSKKMQLHIFFPKLQKIKALPFYGTGKHKYSFQNIEVPPLPIHFCDCEQHYAPHAAKANHVSDNEKQSGGINEEELNVMNSVMNKLFYRESNSKAGSDISEFVKGDVSASRKLNNNEATDEEDEDNLILNVVTKGSNKMTLSGTLEKEPKAKQLRILKDGPLRDTIKANEREVASSKKRKLTPKAGNNVSERNGDVSRIPKGQNVSSREVTDMLPEQHPPPGLQLGSNESKGVHTWSQKSSWKQLVGDKGNNLFSISSVLPGHGAGSRKKNLKYGGKSGLSKEWEEEVAEETQTLSNAVINKEVPEETQPSSVLKNEQIAEKTQPSSVLKSEQIAGISQPSNAVKNEELAEEPQPHDNGVKDEHIAEETQPSSNSFGNSGRGTSWFHKSSWTQLINDTNNSFSISQIIPTDIAIEKEETTTFTGQTLPTVEKKNKSEVAKNSSDMVSVQKEHSAPKRPAADISSAGTYSFVRSAASLKEWASTKAVLSGSAKRKNRDN